MKKKNENAASQVQEAAEKKEKSAEKGSLGRTVRAQFSSASSRNGSFSVILVAVALVIVVLINLIVGQLPASARSIDISDTKIYQISDTTKDLLSSLTSDVDVIVVAEDNSVDQRIVRFLDRYNDYEHVNVSYQDPVLHPNVLTDYGVDTNTIVVKDETTGKSATVAISDMITYDQYYSYYYGQQVEDTFDGEGLLTSAINTVARDSGHEILLLQGHGESDLSDSVNDMLSKSNLTTSTVNLLTDNGIPEGAELLVVNNPTSDLAADELSEIRTYLAGGGSLFLIRGVTDSDLPNFDALMEEYGLTMVNSYIGDYTNYYQQSRSPYNFFPTIVSNTSNVDTGSTILVSAAGGMTVSEDKDAAVTVTQLLTTSDSGFRQDQAATLQQSDFAKYVLAARSVKDYSADTGAAEAETSQDEGLMSEEVTVAETEPESEAAEAAAEEVQTEEVQSAEDGTEEETEAADSTKGTMVVLTAPSMIDSEITDRFSNLANLTEFTNLVSSFFGDMNNISIPAKSLAVTYNTVTNGNIWSVLFIAVIPICFLAAGLVVWIRRRKA